MRKYKFTKENKMIEKSLLYKQKSEDLLQTAVKECAKKKGFVNYKLFSADYATGNEILIKFNDECEMADFQFEDFLYKTKIEIVDRLLECELTKETYNLLISELF